MSTESTAETGLREKQPCERSPWIGEEGYVLIGAVSGLVALLFNPSAFGLISIICGVQLFRRHSEPLKLAMMGWGGVGLTLGMALGTRLLG